MLLGLPIAPILSSRINNVIGFTDGSDKYFFIKTAILKTILVNLNILLKLLKLSAFFYLHNLH